MSDVQVIGHAGPSAHTYGEHVWVVATRHMPMPLHTRVTFSVVVFAHWPSMHSLSGSRLSPMFPHVPSAPPPFFNDEHAWQRPVQALLQHTPSMQLPLTHSLPPPHVAPSIFFGTHALMTQ
jgi:hypothetical protein